jgi:hypothetical protein
LAAAITRLAGDRTLQNAMSRAATLRAARLGTWDDAAIVAHVTYEAVLTARREQSARRLPKAPGAGSEPVVRAPQ